MYSIHVYLMLTTYRRGWRRVYPVILPPRRASQKTLCVGHQTTRTNRRLGCLSTRGGFGKLGRTLLLFVGRVSCTGLAHKGDHLRAHLGIGLNMLGRWRKWRRCYRLREREDWRLGAAHATIRRHGAAHATIRGIHDLYGTITFMPWCSAVFTCKRR